MTPTELLTRHGIKIESTAPGRYYATCPRCSAARKLGNQNKKCLGITIDDKSTRWGCSHCGWTGPEKGPRERTRRVRPDDLRLSGNAVHAGNRGATAQGRRGRT